MQLDEHVLGQDTSSFLEGDNNIFIKCAEFPYKFKLNPMAKDF
jgi:hypothetical protein